MNTTFKDIVKSLEELQITIASCRKDSLEKTSSISSMIENAYLKNRVNEEEYIELKKIKLDHINKYRHKCICLDKDRIGVELKNVLSKYKYI